MPSFEAVAHPDGYWYVWDARAGDEYRRFEGADAEERAIECAASENESSTPLDGGSLRERLEGLREGMAAAAQRVYDEWDQDDDGVDEEWGTGGICDGIASAIAELVDDHVLDGGHDGDDHAFLIVTDGRSEAYLVDIHPSHYEEGGGYRWRRLPDVRFNGEMVTIAAVDVGDVLERDDLDR